MADVIKSILFINLFMIVLGIYVGYTVVRGIQAENTETKTKILKYVGIVVRRVGAFAVIE